MMNGDSFLSGSLTIHNSQFTIHNQHFTIHNSQFALGRFILYPYNWLQAPHKV